MKKATLILGALALVLGLSQCKKPNVPEYTGPIGDRIIQKATLTASNGDNGAKVDIQDPQTGELALTWEEGDNIYAYDGFGNVSVLTLNGTGGSSSGTFEGKITVSSSITTDHDITFYYYGKDVNVDNITTDETTIDFTEQYGSLRSGDKGKTVKGKLMAFGKAKYNEAGNYTAELLVPFAIAKLAFNSFSDDPITVTCEDMPIGYTISKDGEISYKYGGTNKAEDNVMTFKENNSSKPYFAVFVPTQDESGNPVEKTYTFTQGEKVETLKAAFSGAYFTAGGNGGAAPVEPYFYFQAKQAGSTVKINFGEFKYSTDGINFADYTADVVVNLTNVGDKVYFKAKSTNNTIGKSFVTTGNLKVSGNIMYLLNGTSPTTEMTNANEYCFVNLFSGCSFISDFSQLQLPATTLAPYCYLSMFNGCTNLTAAPELPATTLASYCYGSMFQDCTNLTAAPELPAENLQEYCYNAMFKGCTKLETAPELPATTLEKNCYGYMFYDCKGLTAAPELSAATLAQNCYGNMFYGCTNLETAPELNATTLANDCYSYMFEGCTNLTAAPALPATTLNLFCYLSMFKDCTNLVTAPTLPATNLTAKCYKNMFNGCSKLSSVTMSATNVDATECLKDWLNGAGTSAATRTVFVAPGMVDAVKATVPSVPDWKTGVQGPSLYFSTGTYDAGGTLRKVAIANNNMRWNGNQGRYEIKTDGQATSYDEDNVDLFMHASTEAGARKQTWPGGSPSSVFFTNSTASESNPSFTVYNGGTAETGWRLLSADEWQYLIFTRETTKPDGTHTMAELNYVNRMSGFIKVGGVLGFVILPDNFYEVGPNHLKLNGLGVYLTKDFVQENDVCGITSDAWGTLQDNGAVFLSMTGIRHGYTGVGQPGETTITYQNFVGAYLASDANVGNSQKFHFNTGYYPIPDYWMAATFLIDTSNPADAKAVRLVKTITY